MFVNIAWLRTMAQEPNQPLRHHQPNRVSQRIARDADFDEAIDRIITIAGVKSSHNELAGECGLQRYVGRCVIPNFADENYLRIQSQQVAKTSRHVEARG